METIGTSPESGMEACRQDKIDEDEDDVWPKLPEVKIVNSTSHRVLLHVHVVEYPELTQSLALNPGQFTTMHEPPGTTIVYVTACKEDDREHHFVRNFPVECGKQIILHDGCYCP